MASTIARPPDDLARGRALFVCAFYAVLTFAWYYVWKHFLADRSPDPAIFENCLWNATHGNGLRSWLEGGGHHLATHFSPIIYLFVPLYALLPSMHVVHAAVCLGTAGAGFALFELARPKLGPRTATLVMGAFLLHPTVVLQTFMEFHEQALAFLPLMLLLLFHERRAFFPMIAAALILLSVREDNALPVIALAFVSWWRMRSPRFAGALLVLGVGWLALYRLVSVGLLGSGQVSPLFALTYGHWGATPGAALAHLATHPVEVVRALASRPVLSYIAQLLGPLLGVLPLGDSIALVGLPQLLMVLLADPTLRILQVRMHYSVVPVTVAYAAAVGTLARFGRARVPAGGLPSILATLMLVVSIATVPIWLKRAIGRLNPRLEEVRAAIAVVPDTASVTAPGYMLNAMARRRVLDFAWGTHRFPTEYVILEGPGRQFFEGQTIDQLDSPAVGDSLARLGLRVIYAQDDFRIWRRGS
jgi:uncharacterized membrane protein